MKELMAYVKTRGNPIFTPVHVVEPAVKVVYGYVHAVQYSEDKVVEKDPIGHILQIGPVVPR